MKRNGFPYAVVFWLLLLIPVLVAVFIQVRNDQAPDDSQASAGSCVNLHPGMNVNCAAIASSNPTDPGGSCNAATYDFNYNECCSVQGSICNTKPGSPSYCAAVINCGDVTPTSDCSGSRILKACNWIPPVVEPVEPPIICGEEGEPCCAGSNQCDGGLRCNPGDFCERIPTAVSPIQVGPGGSCTPNETVIDVCTGSGICCSCSSGSKCLGTGFNSCTEYCGGSVTTPDPDPIDPVDPPVQPDPGTTGSSCSASAPVKAKLVSPGNGAVINTNSVTLSWERNGSWGVGCPENDNEFRVRVAVVDPSSACPTDTSLGSYSRVGVVEGGPTGSFNLSVENGKKYCWLIRKNNGSISTDSGIRSFTVNIEAPIDPGIDTELTGGGSFVDESEGEVLGLLPDSAIDNPTSLIVTVVGIFSILLGIKLYNESKLSRKGSS